MGGTDAADRAPLYWCGIRPFHCPIAESRFCAMRKVAYLLNPRQACLFDNGVSMICGHEKSAFVSEQFRTAHAGGPRSPAHRGEGPHRAFAERLRIIGVSPNSHNRSSQHCAIDNYNRAHKSSTTSPSQVATSSNNPRPGGSCSWQSLESRRVTKPR